jgi:hypothetical protein
MRFGSKYLRPVLKRFYIMFSARAAPAGEPVQLQCAFPRAYHASDGGGQMMQNPLLRSLIVCHAMAHARWVCRHWRAAVERRTKTLCVQLRESSVEDISRWTAGVNIGQAPHFIKRQPIRLTPVPDKRRTAK